MSGLQGITINTDPAAEAHIYAEDDAAVYQSIVGVDGVFDTGQKFAATVLSNNKVKIADGVACIGGHFARIPYGSYVECEIANGQSGYKRNDIIIGKFITTGSGGTDIMSCEVKQGVAGTTASDPAITQGNLYEGALVRELPLYRVRIEGLNIVAVEQLFTVTPTIPALLSRIESLQSQADELNRKFVSYPVDGTLSSEGDLATTAYWADVIPIVFEPTDRTGWLWNFVRKPNDGKIYICGYGVNSTATGSVNGHLHCLRK